MANRKVKGVIINMVIIFDIRNTQECYAESMELIGLIERSSVDASLCKVDNVYIESRYDDIDIDILTNIHNALESSCLTSVLDYPDIDEIYANSEHIRYLFHVTSDSEESDIVNVQYFSLIRQNIRNCYLLLQPKCNELKAYKASEMSETEIKKLEQKYSELYSKAGLFLLYELQACPQQYYYKTYKEGQISIKELKYTKNISIIKKMSPLIEISPECDSVDYWSRPMELFLDKKLGYRRLSDIVSANILNYKKDVNKKAEQYKKAWINKNFQLLMIIRNLFCFGDCRISQKTYDSFFVRNSFFDSKTFYKHIKDMPVLAFYIMCFYEYYTYKIEKVINNDEDYLKRIIFDARDMADGLMQLIENAMNHSESGKGYFYFRIYSTKAIDEIKELKTRFNNYLSKTEEDATYFLEARVIDYSRVNLPSKFLSKTHERMEQSDDSSAGKYKKVINEFASIQMKSFFNPNEIEKKTWTLYNSIDKNVIHHYGLQLFDSLVTNSEGCFIAVSSSDYNTSDSGFYSNTEKMINMKMIPGTQYSVLIPFRGASIGESNYAALSGKVNFRSNIGDVYVTEKGFDFSEANCKSYYKKSSSRFGSSLQEQKEKLIDTMSKDFSDYIDKYLEIDPNTIFYYDAGRIPNRRIEFFAKALISYLLKNQKSKINIAIFNCDDNFTLETIRIFAIFYNKEGKNEYMHNAQVYLYGKNAGEEFVVSGNNLASFLSYSDKLAFAQGANPRYVKAIFQVLDKRFAIQDDIGPLVLAPFALQLYPGIDQKKTPFERSVKKVLGTDIQKISFGCKLNNTHMRIGSKIHINNFYEAELLFHNSYYVSHFSYILAKRIYSRINNAKPADASNIVLVGYETYSEMLLYETMNILSGLYNGVSEDSKSLSGKQTSLWSEAEEHEQHDTRIDYIIYSDNKKTFSDQNLTDTFNFKYIEKIEELERALFIVVVPINSTLTTHNKVSAALAKYIKARLKSTHEPEIIVNYAIVLIRDSNKGALLSDEEDRFWTSIDTDCQIISTPLIEYGEKGEVSYFIDVCTKWAHPLTCIDCFPLDMQYSEEKPLIETDKASVVPMQKIGLTQGKSGLKNDTSYSTLMSSENMKRIELLKDYLIYKHIERKNNHFSFYIQTEKLMIEKRKEIAHWLEKLSMKPDCEKDLVNKRLTYDIIVAPMHFSNSAFVKEFEHNVFSDASLVLFIDAEREFRDNIKTKYSNLLALYQNLDSENKQSDINFHFIDDTIVSGNSFMRVKSLITSIFPDEALINKTVNVRIFRSITLLVNRCSNATKKNYIDDIDMFKSFVDINLSSMRNHEDACVLCKYVDNSRLLSEYSATNALGNYYHSQMGKHKCDIIKESIAETDIDKNKVERAYRRLMCSHVANCELQKAGVSANSTEKAIEIMKGLFLKNPSPEYFLSYIKTLSRPFFSYAKSYKEAIFYIMIKVLDYLLFTQSESKEVDRTSFEEIYDIIDGFISYDIQYVLLITLMKRLSDMGSSFIIRKDNIRRILTYRDCIAKQIDSDDKNNKETERFDKDYLSAIKRITCLSNDETKCVFLEYLLIFGEEYCPKTDKEIFMGKFSAKAIATLDPFRYKAYIENNRLIVDSIKDLYHDLIPDIGGIMDGLKTSITDDRLCCEDTVKKLKQILNNQYYYENFIKTLVFIDAVSVEGGRIKEFKDNFQFRIIAVIAIYHLLINEKTMDVGVFYKILAFLIRFVSSAKVVSIVLHDGKTQPVLLHTTENEDKNDGLNYAQFLSRKFDLDTYHIIDDNSIILRYEISLTDSEITKRIVFVVIESSGLNDLFFINAIKSIMMFRKMIVSKLTHDFTNNLITDMIAERNKAEALAHFKNATHNDSRFKKDFISRYLSGGEHDTKYITDYKAAAIRFLSDSFISEKYHNAIVKSMSNDGAAEAAKLSSIKLEDTWVMKNFDLLCKTAYFRRPETINNDIPDDLYRKLHVLYVRPRKESGDADALSIFLPMVQNAVGYTDKYENIVVSVERADTKEYSFTIYDAVDIDEVERKQGVLYYLTIENEVLKKDVTAESIKACLLKNIHERRIEGYENEGITLYAANKYCEDILKSIEDYNFNTDVPVINFTRYDSKVIFKLPILVEWI